MNVVDLGEPDRRRAPPNPVGASRSRSAAGKADAFAPVTKDASSPITLAMDPSFFAAGLDRTFLCEHALATVLPQRS